MCFKSHVRLSLFASVSLFLQKKEKGFVLHENLIHKDFFHPQAFLLANMCIILRL